MRKSIHTHFGVLLTQDGLNQLGEALRPYLQKGPIGEYIYAKAVEQHGYFILVTIHPDQVGDRILDTMTIWIPCHFVKFVVGSDALNLVGFHTTSKEGSEE